MNLNQKHKAVGSEINILIVDDHPLFREGLQLLLSELSENLSFSNAVGLRTITHQMLDDADLILLDLCISDSTGYDSLAKLRAMAPSSTVVVISSDDNPETILACIDGGAAGFVPKTSKPQELVSALRLVLEGGIYLPPNDMKDVMLSDAQDNSLERLTPRQRKAVLLAGRGLPNKSIAIEMGITEGTVKLHLSAAYKLLGVKNRTEAMFIISHSGLTFQQADMMSSVYKEA
ncbi:MAG: response regulator [Granulosicoccus sp.]